MTLSESRLNFLYDFYSEREISRQTGIPRSTLYDVKNARYTLPEKYYTTLRNYYQRGAYDLLRSSGLSTKESDRYKWYAPQAVYDVLEIVVDIGQSLALQSTKRKCIKLDADLIEYDFDKIYQEKLDAIVRNMRKSKKPLEVLETYS